VAQVRRDVPTLSGSVEALILITTSNCARPNAGSFRKWLSQIQAFSAMRARCRGYTPKTAA